MYLSSMTNEPKRLLPLGRRWVVGMSALFQIVTASGGRSKPGIHLA